MSDLVAPDAGAHRTPYCCTYHWFRLADGRMVNLDLVRSDDKGRDVLRVFVAEPAGALRGLVVEAPQSDWAPFAATATDVAASQQNALARGASWISAHARGDGRLGLAEASFALAARPLVAGRGPGRAGLLLAELSVVDYTRVHYTGTLTLDGERFTVDSVGPASVHSGARLCEYAYLATVPTVPETERPSLLLAAVRRDDFKWGGALLGDASVLYAWGDGGAPCASVHVGALALPIDLGGGTVVEVSDIRAAPHLFLDEPDRTATALATLSWTFGDVEQRTELGRVVLDLRGAHYVGLLDGK